MNFYHKAISLAGFVLLTVLPAQAQVRQTREEYINKYKKIAVAHMERYGIPASITMAQGILESDCGNSWLSQASNNHFGIKCKRNWTGDVVYYDDDEKGECFRSYPSVEASYQDHAEFLDSQPRYDSLFSYAPNDYKSWARGLKAAVTLRLRTMRSDSSASSKRVNSTCSTARTDLPFTERKPDTSPTTGSRAKATSIKPQRSLRGQSIPTTTA